MSFDDLIEKSRDDMIKDLQALVRIKSVEAPGENGYPFGQGVHDCLEACLAVCDRLGFAARNFDEMCGYTEYGSGENMIAVLVHLDVVPEGDGWTYDPYGAKIADGRLYGRGSLDDKGPAVAAIYALKAIRDSDLPLRHRIRIIFGLNEENGSKCLKYYISHEGELPIMGFTPDAGYPVINGEKGSARFEYHFPFAGNERCRILELQGGTAFGAVPSAAHALLAVPAWVRERTMLLNVKDVRFTPTPEGLRVDAKGVTAHGGRPELGENAIGRLFLALAHIPLEGASAKLVDFMNTHFGMQTRGEGLGIAMSDTLSGDLVLNLGSMRSENGEVFLKISIRYPVSYRYEQFCGTVRACMGDGGFTESFFSTKNSLYIPPENELIRKLSAVYEQQTGQPGTPRCIGGGTYAKEMANIAAFGPNFPGDESRIHKTDEYMDLNKLIRHAKMDAAAMYALAK